MYFIYYICTLTCFAINRNILLFRGSFL